jgi:TRAP-type C4-dicarboxylate transport system permease small subunit
MIFYLEKISKFLNKLLLGVGGVTLAGMVLLTCSNIFLRVVWIPLEGTFELMGFFGALVTAFALGHTHMKRGHIAVDIVVSKFSKKTRVFLNSANYLICTMFFAIAAWQIAKWATKLWKTGEITETLRIIYFPFTYGVALGCAALSLVLLIDFFKTFILGEDLGV